MTIQITPTRDIATCRQLDHTESELEEMASTDRSDLPETADDD